MSKDQVSKALGTGVVIEALGVESMTGAESIAPEHMGRGARSRAKMAP